MSKLPIIICGSGNSVPFLNSRYYSNHFSHGLEMKLEEIIKGNYSIGLNYWYKYGCPTTIVSFADYQFYQFNFKDLAKIPLIIGSHAPQLKKHNEDNTHSNTILLKNSGVYNGKDSIAKGLYTKQLIGMWSLSLAIALGFKEIYLLGYDGCEINGQTHFYQGVIDITKTMPEYLNGKHVNDLVVFHGVGRHQSGNVKGQYKTSTYNSKKHLNQEWFAPFHADRETRKNIKIYNVSPESAIDVFPKISYEEFYSKIKNNNVWQDDAREDIKKIINEKLNN